MFSLGYTSEYWHLLVIAITSLERGFQIGRYSMVYLFYAISTGLLHELLLSKVFIRTLSKSEIILGNYTLNTLQYKQQISF